MLSMNSPAAVCLAALLSSLFMARFAGGADILVSTGAVWKYLPITNDLGAAWRESGHDDASWASGPAQLGYGDQDEATVVPFYFDQDGGKNTSTYFRHAFLATNTSRYTNLLVRLLRDDGAVVYLNGVELFRDNLPAGEITHATLAIRSISSPEENYVFIPTNVPPAALREGVNVLAIEIHQASRVNQDISLDVEVIGERPPPSQPPVVKLTAPFPGTTLGRGADLPIAATASDPDGTVTSVEFFAGSVLVGSVSAPPFSIVLSNLPTGPHVLQARATDNTGAQTTSLPVLVGVGGFSLIRTGAVWKYLDDQTDPGTVWREPEYDDRGWSNGVAPLGFGDGDEATVIRWKIDEVPIITAYFRLQFVVEKPEAFSSVMLRLLRDDGAVVYLTVKKSSGATCLQAPWTTGLMRRARWARDRKKTRSISRPISRRRCSARAPTRWRSRFTRSRSTAAPTSASTARCLGFPRPGTSASKFTATRTASPSDILRGVTGSFSKAPTAWHLR